MQHNSLTGTGRDDVINVTTDGHPGNQKHVWALKGDDTTMPHVPIDEDYDLDITDEDAGGSGMGALAAVLGVGILVIVASGLV